MILYIGFLTRYFNFYITLILVLVKPIAVSNCSTNVTVKEGDDLKCQCNSAGGNPPPTASWYKDGKVVSGPGYLRKILSFINISKEASGNYNCIVKSHNLIDTKSVKIQVHCK